MKLPSLSAWFRWMLVPSLLFDRFQVATGGLSRFPPELQGQATGVAIFSSAVLVLWALRVRWMAVVFGAAALVASRLDLAGGYQGHAVVVWCSAFCVLFTEWFTRSPAVPPPAAPPPAPPPVDA